MVLTFLMVPNLNLHCYLNNPTNGGKYTIEDLCCMEGKILDTRTNDLRIYTGKCPTLCSQRDGVLYVRNGKYISLQAMKHYCFKVSLVNMPTK